MNADETHADMVTLRPCCPGDEPFLFELFKSAKGEEFSVLGWPPEQLEPLLRIQHLAQSQSYAATFPYAVHEIICSGGQPVGRLLTDETADALRLVDIALMPACRGRGIGASLIRGLQARCAEGGKPLTLHVARTNPAIRLYGRLGFVVTGDAGVYLPMEWRPPS